MIEDVAFKSNKNTYDKYIKYISIDCSQTFSTSITQLRLSPAKEAIFPNCFIQLPSAVLQRFSRTWLMIRELKMFK